MNQSLQAFMAHLQSQPCTFDSNTGVESCNCNIGSAWHCSTPQIQTESLHISLSIWSYCGGKQTPSCMTVLWVFISPNSSVDDLHDTLVDALAHIDEWCATFPHFPQQQTWEQITQSHSCLLIVVVQPSYPDKEKKTLQNLTNCIVVSWLVI